MKDWKACERRAELLEGIRVPVRPSERRHTGRRASDAIHEVKSSRKMPLAWLMDALEQAQAATEDGRLPVAVLRQDRKPYRDALVVVRLEDFANYMKGEAA